MSRICPKCNKSRETVKEKRSDPKKKGREWRVEFCPSCDWNFDLEEVKKGEDINKQDPPDSDGGYNWGITGRW